MELHGIITLAVALVAQLDRVSDYESEGQGFESLPAHQARFPFGNRAFLCVLYAGTKNVQKVGRAPENFC